MFKSGNFLSFFLPFFLSFFLFWGIRSLSVTSRSAKNLFHPCYMCRLLSRHCYHACILRIQLLQPGRADLQQQVCYLHRLLPWPWSLPVRWSKLHWFRAKVGLRQFLENNPFKKNLMEEIGAFKTPNNESKLVQILLDNSKRTCLLMLVLAAQYFDFRCALWWNGTQPGRKCRCLHEKPVQNPEYSDSFSFSFFIWSTSISCYTCSAVTFTLWCLLQSVF